MVYLQGAGMVYYQLVCAWCVLTGEWPASTSMCLVSVSRVIVLTVGCNILYVCLGSGLLGDVHCYHSAMHFYCRKPQQHLVYAHEHRIYAVMV